MKIHEAIADEIRKMTKEHREDSGADHTAPVFQNHPFATALIFLKDRIAARLGKERRVLVQLAEGAHRRAIVELIKFVNDMEIGLCAHSDETVPTRMIAEYMSTLQDHIRRVAPPTPELLLELRRQGIIEEEDTPPDIARIAESARKHDHHFHPSGRCTCGGEGRCDWCRSNQNTVAEIHTGFEPDKVMQVEESPHLCDTCGADTDEVELNYPCVWLKDGNGYICTLCRKWEADCTCDPKDVVGWSPEEYWAAMKDADAEGNVEPGVTREFDISALMDRGYTHSEAQAEVDGEEVMERTVGASHFVGTLAANVDNEKIGDAGFREFIRNTLPIVIYDAGRFFNCPRCQAQHFKDAPCTG
jgi:hypothetical protein